LKIQHNFQGNLHDFPGQHRSDLVHSNDFLVSIPNGTVRENPLQTVCLRYPEKVDDFIAPKDNSAPNFCMDPVWSADNRFTNGFDLVYPCAPL